MNRPEPGGAPKVFVERRAHRRKVVSDTTVRMGALVPSRLLRQVKLPDVVLIDLSESGGLVRARASSAVQAGDRLVVELDGHVAEVVVARVLDDADDQGGAAYGFVFASPSPAFVEAVRARIDEDRNALEFLWRVWGERAHDAPRPTSPSTDADPRGRVRAVAIGHWRRSAMAPQPD